jgi:transposase
MDRRYKQGTARGYEAQLPRRIEDFVGADNPVRAIDAYVDTLDLEALGFVNAGGRLRCGPPAFAPAALLKLYVAGYLDRVHSSRRLAHACRRNLEFMWLLEGLTPGDRTIATFRQFNGPALRAVCKDFMLLCQDLDLLGGEEVGIDGAFFNASASDASVITKTTLEKRLKQIECDIAAYHQDLETQDADERGLPEDLSKAPELAAKIVKRQARQARHAALLKQLEDSGETQISRTDPDARALRKGGQQLVGYHVQSSVDRKHRLIAHDDVTNAGNDTQQLAPQALAVKEVLGVETMTVVVDAGYFNEAQLATCAQANITVYVPIPDYEQRLTAAGRLSGANFTYLPETNVYVCPGGQELHQYGEPHRRAGTGTLYTRYSRPPGACQDCPLKASCLPASGRRQIERSEHASVVEDLRQRMADQGPARMRQRAGLVEHPYGTLKRWFGWDHFLVRGFEKVWGEMSLMVLGYNLTRVIHILGAQAFRDYCAQRLTDRLLPT